MRLAKAHRRLDSFVDSVRRHADIGDDDVGALGLDRREERFEVTADGCDLEIGLRLEQTPDALADEVVILGEDEANRHRQKNTAAADGNAARGSAAADGRASPPRDTPAAR